MLISNKTISLVQMHCKSKKNYCTLNVVGDYENGEDVTYLLQGRAMSGVAGGHPLPPTLPPIHLWMTATVSDEEIKHFDISDD